MTPNLQPYHETITLCVEFHMYISGCSYKRFHKLIRFCNCCGYFGLWTHNTLTQQDFDVGKTTFTFKWQVVGLSSNSQANLRRSKMTLNYYSIEKGYPKTEWSGCQFKSQLWNSPSTWQNNYLDNYRPCMFQKITQAKLLPGHCETKTFGPSPMTCSLVGVIAKHKQIQERQMLLSL